MKYLAICFTDEKYQKTRERYAAQLLSKGIFDSVIQYSPDDFDKDFKDKHGKFIAENPKGYGYYIWKPYLILKTLEMMDDGDILVYGDAGNEMKGTPEECLLMIDQVKIRSRKIPILAAKGGWCIRWIKSDLYITMGYKIFTPFKRMVEAGRIVILKNEITMSFFKEWRYYATSDYSNIDDSESTLPNLPLFIEHRHDQSIFSILFHKYKGRIVDFGDVWEASRLRF